MGGAEACDAGVRGGGQGDDDSTGRREGLADVAREKGRLVLKLKSGQEAPVSRTYAPAVRQRGWI
jgi:hypothetical protein